MQQCLQVRLRHWLREPSDSVSAAHSRLQSLPQRQLGMLDLMGQHVLKKDSNFKSCIDPAMQLYSLPFITA